MMHLGYRYNLKPMAVKLISIGQKKLQITFSEENYKGGPHGFPRVNSSRIGWLSSDLILNVFFVCFISNTIELEWFEEKENF